MTPQELTSLHEDLGTLAQVTSSPGWEIDDSLRAVAHGKAMAIGWAQWTEAMLLAVIVDREVPGLPTPQPEADPLGFIWLRWKTETRELALRLRSSLALSTYEWDRMSFGTRSSVESSNSLRNLAEALRATFGHTEAVRMETVH